MHLNIRRVHTVFFEKNLVTQGKIVCTLNCGSPSAPVFGRPGAEDWFALRVSTNSEVRTLRALEGKGVESYLPQVRQYRYWGRRTRQVERALFPGYVFARFHPANRLPILTISTVAYIIGTSDGPTPVDCHELDSVRRAAESDSMVEPYPLLAEGDLVSIEDGPLRGLMGRLVSIGPDLRLVVSISLLQRSISVAIDRRWVRPTAEGGVGLPRNRSMLSR